MCYSVWPILKQFMNVWITGVSLTDDETENTQGSRYCLVAIGRLQVLKRHFCISYNYKVLLSRSMHLLFSSILEENNGLKLWKWNKLCLWLVEETWVFFVLYYGHKLQFYLKWIISTICSVTVYLKQSFCL